MPPTMLTTGCENCRHAKGKWSCWKRILYCTKYHIPAIRKCIDWVKK